MSRSQKHTNLKHYKTISSSNDPKGTCCICDGRKVYTTKSACEALVDSYFAEGQYPSRGMHPCYGHVMNPTEIGLCLHSNKTSSNIDLNSSYTCTPITVGGQRNDGKINYCDFETIFGSRASQRKSEYEFRFIPLPDWSVCGTQSGDTVPLEFVGKDFAKDSIQTKRIIVFDTVKQQGPIKKPVHRNAGTIVPIVKNQIDITKVLQITEKRDSKNQRVLKLKTRLGGDEVVDTQRSNRPGGLGSRGLASDPKESPDDIGKCCVSGICFSSQRRDYCEDHNGTFCEGKFCIGAYDNCDGEGCSDKVDTER